MTRGNPTYTGKTAYPRDVATKKHVDRVQDRLDRRIDLHGEKVERLKAVQIALEREIRDLQALFQAVFSRFSSEAPEEE